MEQFSLKVSEKEKLVYKSFVESESPEQPLIHVSRNIEANQFEAVFALELNGVTRREILRESYNSDEKKNADTELYCNSLLAGLSECQRLDFVYTGGRNNRGQEFFDWKILGHSNGNSNEEVLQRTKQLYHSLFIFLGNAGKDYCFVPVNKPEKFDVTRIEKPWIAEIQTSGIAIDGGRQRKIGFTVKNNELDSMPNTVIVPYSMDKSISSFDSVVTGAVKCPTPVRLVLSITPFFLSVNELRKIGAALEWLQNGGTMQIRYSHELENGIEELETLNGLKRNLIQWLRNHAGLRITCMAIAENPIPRTYLSMIGNELFPGCPITVKTNQETPHEDSGEVVLDLCGCINGDSVLPPLFPGIMPLIDCGTRRVYMQSALNLPETGVLTGRTSDNKDVRFARADRSRHAYIIGATGTGKSTLLYNMIIQDIQKSEGVAVIDPHGDLYQQVLESIPRHRAEDVVLVNPCDFEHSVGINFLECNGPCQRVQTNFVVNEMIKIFDRLYDMRVAGGPIFEQYMRNAMLLVMESDYHVATLMDVPFVFEEKEFRDFLLNRCKNPVVVNFWKKQAVEAGGDASLKNMAPYITSKLNQFTTNALLRPIIGQPESTINFQELIDAGRILLVNLSKGVLGEMDTQLLGMLIIGKIFTAAMSRTAARAERRRSMFLYVDEFQTFTTDTVAHLLSEARKFGLYLTLANQNLAQLSININTGRQNVLDAVLGNVGTMLLFRLGAVDAAKMEIYTRPELDAQDLQELPDFYAAGRLLVNNSPSKPFVFKTLPGLEITNVIDVNSVISTFRKKYAMPTKQVEEEIINRRESYKL